MENVLSVCCYSYDEGKTVVCMDEKPIQFFLEVFAPVFIHVRIDLTMKIINILIFATGLRTCLCLLNRWLVIC